MSEIKVKNNKSLESQKYIDILLDIKNHIEQSKLKLLERSTLL